MSVLPFTIDGSGGRPIRGDLHLPAGDERCPVVVGCHGFKGFRNWGFWPHIAAGLAGAGFAAVRFDMSHNGVGAGGFDFDEKDLFEANTWAREEHDLGVVLDAVRAGTLPGAEQIDPGRLGLIGHSRGGGLAVVRAAQDEGVRATVVLAPIASLYRFSEEALEAGRANGFLPIVNTRTGEVLRLGIDAIEEMVARTDLHDIAASYASRMTRPLLVCHGSADPAVSPSDGQALADAAPHGTYASFEAADHVLDCRHPWSGTTPHFARFLSEATRFLSANISTAHTSD